MSRRLRRIRRPVGRPARSSLDFFIHAFTKTVEWEHYHEVKQDVLLKIAAIIQAHGAGIALPTRTLHIESDAGEARAAP